MSVPLQGCPGQFHYPTEVVATMREFADQPTSNANNVAGVYFAEVESHLTLDALRFVATGVGIAELQPGRADLVAQIRAYLQDWPKP
jgi:hypothetical protein